MNPITRWLLTHAYGVICVVSTSCVNLHIRFDECSMNSIVIYMFIQSFSRQHFHNFLYLLDQGSALGNGGRFFFSNEHFTLPGKLTLKLFPLFRFAKFITGLLALVPSKNSILHNKNETELSALSVYRVIERRLETKSSVEKFRLCYLHCAGICVPSEMKQKISGNWPFMWEESDKFIESEFIYFWR